MCIRDRAAAAEERFLMLVQPLPDELVANALAVQAAYREYPVSYTHLTLPTSDLV